MAGTAPSVFISSTFYDLNEVRFAIREFIEALGWRPVLSEFDSFPINPDLGTVENCRQAVEGHADIFVLIVGGRYGTVDPTVDSSITNIEFDMARAMGIPTYAFVRRDILDMEKIWRANPDADFTSVVDSPRVFEFVSSFRETGDLWVFPFERSDGIIATLRVQLASLAGDALELRLRARSTEERHLLAELTGSAFRILVHQEANWRHRLFAQVLSDEIKARSRLHDDFIHNLSIGPVEYVGPLDFAEWAQDRLHELEISTQAATSALNEYFPEALGVTPDEGAPLRIIHAAKVIGNSYEAAIDWTLRCRRARVDSEFERARELLSAFSSHQIDQISEYGIGLIHKIDDVIDKVERGEAASVEATLILTVPDDGELGRELNRLQAEYFGS